MKNIKTILFDLDGTLRQNVPNSGQVFMDYLRDRGLHFSEEDQLRAQRWEHFYFASSLEIRADREAYKDRNDFWVNFARRRLMALRCDQDHVRTLAMDIAAFMTEDYKPQAHIPEEAFELLESLKKAGATMGVVSNRENSFQDELKELKLDSFFKFSLAAGEAASYKPGVRIFERALELAGTTAAETMYVGDNYYADVVGARRAGIIPVLFDPDTVFPEVDCAVIRRFGDIHDLLN